MFDVDKALGVITVMLMKVYTVFNSYNDLLATFTSKRELGRYIVRHSRCVRDTTVLVTNANSWNEIDEVRNCTETIISEIWRKHEIEYERHQRELAKKLRASV